MKKQYIKTRMYCDPVTGVCELPGEPSIDRDIKIVKEKKPMQLVYFTDPICSSCWGIEPQLRKLKLEYGDNFDIEYRMGGLLPSWESYGGRDVGSPTDVAKHWDDVSRHYEMPIDGDLWLEDPLTSSYPPSIAFKAAQLQSEEKAIRFLRRIKEMVFVEKKNISKWEHLEQAALQTGLDIKQLKIDYEGKGRELFEEDLKLSVSLSVRGFPTIFFRNEDDNHLRVYGVKPYEHLVQTLLLLYPDAKKSKVDFSVDQVFSHYPTLTTKEFAVITSRTIEDAEDLLTVLFDKGELERYSSKNGSIWRKKTSLAEQAKQN